MTEFNPMDPKQIATQMKWEFIRAKVFYFDKSEDVLEYEQILTAVMNTGVKDTNGIAVLAEKNLPLPNRGTYAIFLKWGKWKVVIANVPIETPKE